MRPSRAISERQVFTASTERRCVVRRCVGPGVFRHSKAQACAASRAVVHQQGRLVRRHEPQTRWSRKMRRTRTRLATVGASLALPLAAECARRPDPTLYSTCAWEAFRPMPRPASPGEASRNAALRARSSSGRLSFRPICSSGCNRTLASRPRLRVGARLSSGSRRLLRSRIHAVSAKDWGPHPLRLESWAVSSLRQARGRRELKPCSG